MLYRYLLLLGVAIAFVTVSVECRAGDGKGKHVEFPDFDVLGNPQGNTKRLIELGLYPGKIRGPRVSKSGHVEYWDVDVLGNPQGNFKRWLEQKDYELYNPKAIAQTTEKPSGHAIFEVDLTSVDNPSFREVANVTEPGRLFLVRKNDDNTGFLTLSVKRGNKAVLSMQPLKKGDYIPGAAAGGENVVYELVSDDPKGMTWDELEWTGSYASFVKLMQEKKGEISRETIIPHKVSSTASPESRTLEGFIFAGSTTRNTPLANSSYNEERTHFVESIGSFANKNYCSNVTYKIDGKDEFGSGKDFGHYSRASLSFDVSPREGYIIHVFQGDPFKSKESDGSAASLDFLGKCRASQLAANIEKIGGHSNYIASDCGEIEIRKIPKNYFVNWQFLSQGMRVLYWVVE